MSNTLAANMSAAATWDLSLSENSSQAFGFLEKGWTFWYNVDKVPFLDQLEELHGHRLLLLDQSRPELRDHLPPSPWRYRRAAPLRYPSFFQLKVSLRKAAELRYPGPKKNRANKQERKTASRAGSRESKNERNKASKQERKQARKRGSHNESKKESKNTRQEAIKERQNRRKNNTHDGSKKKTNKEKT